MIMINDAFWTLTGSKFDPTTIASVASDTTALIPYVGIINNPKHKIFNESH